MSPAPQSTPLPLELGIPVSDWQRTPTTVQDEFLAPAPYLWRQARGSLLTSQADPCRRGA